MVFRLPVVLGAGVCAAVVFCLVLTGCESGGSSGGDQNTAPTASFTATPAAGTTSTAFQFNAGGCTDAQDAVSALQVRWDWNDDGTFDTAYSTTKTANHQFAAAGTYTVRCQVRDSGGLTATTTRTVTVTEAAGNTAPTAAFAVTPTTGTTATAFGFDGSGSTDNEDAAGALQVRWDWTDDGTFDTALSTTKTATHQYTTAGTYTVRMEVQDTGGLTDSVTHSVTVTAGGGAAVSVLFIHHSVGNDLVERGDVRSELAAYDTAHGTDIAFWDHEYNSPGLRDPSGEWVGSYNIPGDNTDPDGYHALWTSAEADWATCRGQILGNHQVIAFKSCFPTSQIESDARLAQYQTWYLAMRDFFDTRPDRQFIVVTPPPLHRLSNDAAWATRARAFADWLGSATYLSGHPNVHCYDLFDAFANADDGSATANMLRYNYETSHEDGDSHPNALADETVGPAFAAFIGGVVSGL